jgi:hypothetical protein
MNRQGHWGVGWGVGNGSPHASKQGETLAFQM